MKKEMAEVEQLGKKSSGLKSIVIIIIILVLLVVGYFSYLKYVNDRVGFEEELDQQTSLTLSETITDSRISKIADTEGAFWVREIDLIWAEIEPVQGQLDFSIMDQKIRMVLEERKAYPIVNIRPFVNWDQDRCHQDAKYMGPEDLSPLSRVKLGRPCDMEAYQNFLKKVVERYNGDGVNDMPGLTQPIRYWEIINEPIMQGGSTGGAGEELKFFVGNSDDYLETLKASYQAIKEADPKAMVLNGGMAGMQQEVKDFWGPILAKGGGDYFDIANNHTISTTSDRADLYMIEFKKFLAEYDLEDKPVWLTEVQYGSLTEEPDQAEREEIEQLMVKSAALAYSLGAEKLFFIQNWLFWQMDMEEIVGEKQPPKPGQEPEKKPIRQYPQEALDSTTHQVYLTLVDKLNYFDEVEVIREDYDTIQSSEGATTARTTIGQYKFTTGNDELYLLWGQAELPRELTGNLKVTDIYGQSTIRNIENITLTDDPIYVELAE